MAEPYSMLKAREGLTGNDMYEGYAIGKCLYCWIYVRYLNRKSQGRQKTTKISSSAKYTFNTPCACATD